MNRRAIVAMAMALLLAVGASACTGSPAWTEAGAASGPRTDRPSSPDEGNSSHDPSSSGSTTTTPSLGTSGEEVDGFRPQPLSWNACNRGLECTHLAVPLDWNAPTGDTIMISIIRRPARDQDRRIGSIVVNPGGPGASGIDTLRSSNIFDDRITTRFDVVSFDPRGVGESAPLQCGATVSTFLAVDPDPDDAAEQAELDNAAKAVADECSAKDGAVLPHVGTADVARDLEALRIALGEPKLNYFGFSYGTLIGLLYADQFPTHIRAMVLDGVVDPKAGFADFLRGQATAIQHAIDRIAASCADDAECPVDDMNATYDKLATEIDTQPLRVEDAGSISRSLGPAELITATILATYAPAYHEPFLLALSAAEHGNGAGLLQLSDQYRSFGGFTLYTAVECLDSAHPQGAAEFQTFAAELETISPRFGAAIANELLSCAFWPTPPVRQPAKVTAKGSPPILVVGNTGDAATPYVQAQSVAKDLDAGVLLTYEGEGHTSYGQNDCVKDAVDRYLSDRKPPTAGTRCR